MSRERGAAIIWFLVALALAVTALFVACDALWEDDDEADDLGWVPAVESSERPGGRDGDARDGDCDGSCGNSHEDCEGNSGYCSDDDGIILCLVPDACRFG